MEKPGKKVLLFSFVLINLFISFIYIRLTISMKERWPIDVLLVKHPLPVPSVWNVFKKETIAAMTLDCIRVQREVLAIVEFQTPGVQQGRTFSNLYSIKLY